MDPAPELSVIVVVGAVRTRVGRLIASLLDDADGARLEILVGDLAPGSGPATWADHPSVTVVEMAPEVGFGGARAALVHRARSSLVCSLEEHTAVDPGFVSAVLASAERDDWVAAGPLVRNGNPGSIVADASFAAGYSLFEPPVPEARLADPPALPGFNTIARRSALVALGEELPRLLTCDNVIHLRLAAEGAHLALVPGAVIRHWNEELLRGTLTGYWWFNRNYGALRARHLRWPWWRRGLYILAFPAIPVYALVLLALRSRHRASPLGWLRVGPIVALATACGALSQAIGLLTGPSRRAEHRFGAFELRYEARGPVDDSGA